MGYRRSSIEANFSNEKKRRFLAAFFFYRLHPQPLRVPLHPEEPHVLP